MKYCTSFALAAALLGAASQTALAQSPAETVQACLDSTPNNTPAPDCIGATAQICMDLPGGSTTMGMTTCLSDETKIWREMMASELAATSQYLAKIDADRAGQNDPLVPQLLAAQAVWSDFSALQCSLETSIVIDGTISGPTSAGCELTMTARRTIALRQLRDAG